MPHFVPAAPRRSHVSPFQRLGLRLDASLGASRRRAFRQGWPSRTSEEIAFFDAPLVQYRYRERAGPSSDAPTIVFTADPPVTLEAYDALLSVFARRFRVVVVELPAMGFSAPSTRYRFGFRETNDDLARFLRAVAGPGAIWAFSCAAGLAAADLAARAPDLVSRLVFVQTGDVAAFQRWKAARDPKGVLARPILGQMVMRRLAPKRMPAWFALSVGREACVAPLCACAAESFAHGALWTLASAYQAYLSPDVALAPVRQPVLSLWGRADRSHPPENEGSSGSFAPHARHVAFDDLGHFAEIEDPERVFGEVVRFLDQAA